MGYAQGTLQEKHIISLVQVAHSFACKVGATDNSDMKQLPDLCGSSEVLLLLLLSRPVIHERAALVGRHLLRGDRCAQGEYG